MIVFNNIICFADPFFITYLAANDSLNLLDFYGHAA